MGRFPHGESGPDHKRQKVPTVGDFAEGSGRRSFSGAPGPLDSSVFQIPEPLSPLRPSRISELVRHPGELKEMDTTSSMAPKQPMKFIKVNGKWMVKKPYVVAQKQPLQCTRRRVSAAVRDFPYGCGRKKIEGKVQTRAIVLVDTVPRHESRAIVLADTVPTHESRAIVVKDTDPRLESRAVVVYKEDICRHNKDDDPREKIRHMLWSFQEACRNLSPKDESSTEKQLACRKSFQDEEGSITKALGKPNRIDMKAFDQLKREGMWVAEGKKYLGSVPGTEVGDEFRYRVELCLTGLHRPLRHGIGHMKRKGIPVATSIVCSGGYANRITSYGVLEYSGSGGQQGYQSKREKGKHGDHQTLEGGNLALKNSIKAETPVRVIHGLKERSNNDHRNMKNKPVVKYIYDGLYLVEKCRLDEGSQGMSVYKFQLRRISGQPVVLDPGTRV